MSVCKCVYAWEGEAEQGKGVGVEMAPHMLVFKLLSFTHRHKVISFLATVGYKAFLNVIQRGCEGLRLVCGLQGLLQEVLYQRREEIDSRTSGEQWR